MLSQFTDRMPGVTLTVLIAGGDDLQLRRIGL
jgi:hypothetical protein